VFSDDDLTLLRRFGAHLVTLRPVTQSKVRPTSVPGAQILADVTGVAKRWFDNRPTPVLFLRPDRVIGGACLIQDAPRTLAALARAAHLTPTTISTRKEESDDGEAVYERVG